MKLLLSLFLSVFLLSCMDDDSMMLETTSRKQTLFIIAGQSNAVGQGDSSTSFKSNTPCYEYVKTIAEYKQLKDPVGENEFDFERAATGSFIPALGYTYADLTEENTFIVQTARGGSSLVKAAETFDGINWSEDGDLYDKSILRVASAFYNIPNADEDNIKTVVVWSQGENDGEAIGSGIITLQEYEDALRTLILRYTINLGSNFSFVIIETGRHTACPPCDFGNGLVREAQQRVAATTANVYIGYDKTKDFIELDWLKDPVHYNQEALNDIGIVVAHFITDNIF